MTFAKEQSKHQFHGRRKGKALTAYRQSLLDNDFQNYKVNLDNLNIKSDTWLEIGFGNGEFLSHMVQNYPKIDFIGCEPFVNGIAALLASIQTPVSNLKIWDDNARHLIDALPNHSIDRVYLLNPDPWPKTRHHKRRFVQEDTLNDIARILKSGGDFIMSTDVAELAEWMHWHTWAHSEFEWTATSKEDWLSAPLDWPLDKTRYMKKALGGETIYWLKFKRK
jgi:tRNA (guanine-N7-)-methyltransferase